MDGLHSTDLMMELSSHETAAAISSVVSPQQHDSSHFSTGDILSIGLHHHVAPMGERAVRSISQAMFSKIRMSSVPLDYQQQQQTIETSPNFTIEHVDHGNGASMELASVISEDCGASMKADDDAAALTEAVHLHEFGISSGANEDVLSVEEVHMEDFGQHPPGTPLQAPNGMTYVVAHDYGTSAAAAKAAGASGVFGAGGQFIELPADQVQALLAEARPIKYIPNSAEGAVTYRCPQCPSFFVNASAFTKHMKERHAAKVFVCRQCDAFHSSLSDLFLHARRCHVDVKKPRRDPAHYRFHCAECAYMTNNGGTFEAHQRAHSGEKPFVCDVCGKRFAQKANMKTHRTRHVERDRPFVCDVCHKAFTTNDIYLAHLRTREHELREHFQMMAGSNLLLECLGCATNCDSLLALKKHARGCKIVRTLQTKFRCLPCNAYLAALPELRAHVRAHDGGTRGAAAQPVSVIGCPVCGERGFPGFNQLNHHITRAHSLRVARRHVCRYCMESFESKEEMTAHVGAAHADEKSVRGPRAGPFFCKYHGCAFVSAAKHELVKHHALHAMNRDHVDHALIKARPATAAHGASGLDTGADPAKRRRGRPRKVQLGVGAGFAPAASLGRGGAPTDDEGAAAGRIRFLGPEDFSSDEDAFDDSEERPGASTSAPPAAWFGQRRVVSTVVAPTAADATFEAVAELASYVQDEQLPL